MTIKLFSSIKFFFSFLFIIALTLGLSISFQSLLAAWTAPLANPSTCVSGNPGCNAPVNDSATAQYKAGALGVGGILRGYSTAVFDGNVGIGTASPGAKLEVAGQVKITGGTPGAGKILTSDATGLASWSIPSGSVASVFGRTGAVVAVSGDYTTTLVTEGTNQYFTNARAQAAITGGASTITAANLTANRALLSDASGKVGVSTITNTELGYLSGVTSAIQTQFNAKAPLASPIFTGTVTTPLIKITGGTPGAGKVLTSDAAGLASWQTASGGLGGSGTANYVSKFTAASTLGNSIIYDNGTNVGIGSTDFTSLTGSGNLKVNKDLRVGGVIRGDASGNVIIQLGN